ncbi:MAG: sugar nucleotide-binding protein, partial [Spirochaetales bacterium]|nr:sugar nucleotide-binding protein [Spirochaetales bacterium]
MAKKIIVTGCSGMLGKEFVNACLNETNYELFGIDINSNKLSHKRFEFHKKDLTNFNELKVLIDNIKPDIIIHFAAAINIKKCEEDFGSCTKINTDVIRFLAQFESKVIYISTDSVFNGITGHYSEEDIPDPLNNYAKSKLLGEYALEANNKDHIIVRTNIFGFSMPL